MDQSECEANTCNRRQARENACERITIGLGFASHWLRKWREILNQSRSVVKRKQSARELMSTFNWKPGQWKLLNNIQTCLCEMPQVTAISLIQDSANIIPWKEFITYYFVLVINKCHTDNKKIKYNLELKRRCQIASKIEEINFPGICSFKHTGYRNLGCSGQECTITTGDQ